MEPLRRLSQLVRHDPVFDMQLALFISGLALTLFKLI